MAVWLVIAGGGAADGGDGGVGLVKNSFHTQYYNMQCIHTSTSLYVCCAVLCVYIKVAGLNALS